MFETFPFLHGNLGREGVEALTKVCVYLWAVDIIVQLLRLSWYGDAGLRA